MTPLRPEVTAALHRWREVIMATCVAAAGLWLITLTGWFYPPLGVLLTGAGAASALIGLRRLRFASGTAAPGIVGVLEGQLSYMGPVTGGFLALRDLAEVALVTEQGLRCWRLAPAQGAPLIIPVAAQGADQLFDAFAGLPGLDMPALLAALQGGGGPDRILWRRNGERRALR